MPAELPTSTWQRSTTRRFGAWLFSARTLRRGAIGLIWLVSLTALGYGIIDWYGRSQWNKFRKDYEARVASLDLATYIPKPIPDDENFAAIPQIDLWFSSKGVKPEDSFVSARDLLGEKPPQHHHRTFADLPAMVKAFDAVRQNEKNPKGSFRTENLDAAAREKAAPVVLEDMKSLESQLDELRAASARPGARYPVKYDLDNPWAILLPHLARVKRACQELSFKASAELAAGHSDRAFEDVKTCFYMGDSVKTEPFLISYLVRLACMHIAIQPIWEGLAEHRWTDAQLQELQGALERENYLADMLWPLHAECAAGALTVDLVRKHNAKDLFSAIGDSRNGLPGAAVNILGWIAPSGWYDLEKTRYCQLYESEFHGVLDEGATNVDLARLARNAPRLSDNPVQIFLRHEFIASMILPALRGIPTKAALAQVDANEADVACALERYRLANGQFPESLDDLAPKYIARVPGDPTLPQPLRYVRGGGAQFILYSEAGKQAAIGAAGKARFATDSGDGNWECPWPR